MSKLTAPLLSLKASGTLAGFFTIERRKGKQYGYQKKRGKARASNIFAGYGREGFGLAFYGYSGVLTTRGLSPVQGANRLIFSTGIAQYRGLTDFEKEALSIEAQPLGISGQQLWMRRWMNAEGA